MSDTTQGAKKERSKVSLRDYLGPDGSVVKTIEEATGGRYALLEDDGKTVSKAFDEQFGEAGAFVTMCAIFGFQTKVGNVANTVLNDKDDPGTPDDAAAAISEFIAGGKDGTWADRTGGVGQKVDRPTLAKAVCEVAAAAGKPQDEAAILAKLESDAGYVRKVRQVPEVAQAYSRLAGKQVKTLDDILN